MMSLQIKILDYVILGYQYLYKYLLFMCLIL